MLKDVIDLGAEPSCAATLHQAFRIIHDGTAASQTIGFGRAVLSGSATETNCPFTSLLMLRDGHLTLKDDSGTTMRLGKGDVTVLPAGHYSYHAEAADCIILMLRRDNPAVAFSMVDLNHAMSSGGAPNAALLTTPAPQTSRYEFHDEGAVSWGIWRATPYARRHLTYAFSEVMMLRKGEVIFTDPDGQSIRFGAGDIFIVRSGAVVSWDNPSELEKFWLIREDD